MTTPARTLLDLSGRMPNDELATALDLALTQRAITLAELVSMLAGLPTGGGRRPAKLARLVEMRQEGRRGDSHLEARVIRLLDASGLPPPVCQHPISLEGRRYRLDLAWPELRRFAETDGFAFHGHRSAFDADRRRQNALVAAGWVGVRITSDFTDREVVSAVRALLDVPAGSMPRPAEDPAWMACEILHRAETAAPAGR